MIPSWLAVLVSFVPVVAWIASANATIQRGITVASVQATAHATWVAALVLFGFALWVADRQLTVVTGLSFAAAMLVLGDAK